MFRRRWALDLDDCLHMPSTLLCMRRQVSRAEAAALAMFVAAEMSNAGADDVAGLIGEMTVRRNGR